MHQPVLLNEVLDLLRPTAGEAYLDLTAGYGGHATAIISHTGQPDKAVLVDRDQQAIDVLQKQFNPLPEIIRLDYLAASQQLVGQGRKFDMILADLGISSPHLNHSRRGFSFQTNGPLDMRMDATQALTADEIVNRWEESEISDVLKRYGQEPKARFIARQIVQNRPLATTEQLAAIAKRAWPGHSRVHPATRTFQALRIAVNDELHQLENSLPFWLELLAPGGRLVTISFHSGEDRLVKEFLTGHSGHNFDAELELLTKKPVVAQPNEIAINPRARSAKLRAAVKINKRKDLG